MLEQRAGVAAHDLEVVTLAVVETAGREELLGRPHDERQRRAQLVAHVGEELRLQRVELLQAPVDAGQLQVRHLELRLPVLGGLGRLDEGERARNERRKHYRRRDRRGGREQLHVAREPVHGHPEGPHLHEVGRAAGDDEGPEGEEHPVERDVAARAVHEIGERERDRHVGEADQHVRAHVQPDEARLPEEAVAMRHETIGGEDVSQKPGHPPPFRARHASGLGPRTAPGRRARRRRPDPLPVSAVRHAPSAASAAMRTPGQFTGAAPPVSRTRPRTPERGGRSILSYALRSSRAASLSRRSRERAPAEHCGAKTAGRQRS